MSEITYRITDQYSKKGFISIKEFFRTTKIKKMNSVVKWYFAENKKLRKEMEKLWRRVNNNGKKEAWITISPFVAD